MVHTTTFKERFSSRFKVGMTYHKCLGHNELKIHIKQQVKNPRTLNPEKRLKNFFLSILFVSCQLHTPKATLMNHSQIQIVTLYICCKTNCTQ